MKKRAVLLLLLLAALCLSGCYITVESGNGLLGKDYFTGGAEIENAVENIHVSWLDGSVLVETQEGGKLSFSETAKGAIPAEYALAWRVEGKTLYIEYSATTVQLSTSLEKALTLRVPQSWELKSLDVSSTAASQRLERLKADSISLSSTAGEVEASLSAKKIRMNTTAGNVHLIQAGSADEITINTTAGNIKATVDQVKRLKTDCTSGSVQLYLVNADQVKVSGLNGIAQVAVEKSLNKLELSLTAGSAEIALAPEIGFTAKLDTTIGAVSNAFGTEKWGDGKAQIKADTVAGTISLLKLEESGIEK